MLEPHATRAPAGRSGSLPRSVTFAQRVEDGRIIIEVVPGRHARSLAGSLKATVARRPRDESWEALRRAAWETADPDRRP